MILGTGWIFATGLKLVLNLYKRENTQNEKKTFLFNIFDIIYKQKRYQDRLHVIFK